jgi:hypothetical protein
MINVTRCKESDEHLNKDHFTVSSVQDDGTPLEVTIASEKAQLIHKAVDECFKGVKFRSKYCIATEQHVETGSALAMEVGDLVMLESIFANSEATILYGLSDRSKKKVRCAFFDRDLHSMMMPLVPTPARLKHACDQWHSSRAFTPLTGWHCKLRPNTEGGDPFEQDFCHPLLSTTIGSLGGSVRECGTKRLAGGAG